MLKRARKRNNTVLLFAISIVLFGCGSKQNNTPSQPQRVHDFPTPGPTPSAREVVLYEYDEAPYKEITKKYLEYLESADDKLDFEWKYDYIEGSNILYSHTIDVHDSKPYSTIFNYEKPTQDELIDVLNSNDRIDSQTKQLIEEFIVKWLELWPESDLSVLKHNLANLCVVYESEEEIVEATGDRNAIAAFHCDSDIIRIHQGANIFDIYSEGYQLFIHELIHASRMASIYDGETRTYFGFYPQGALVEYTDEALVNMFAKRIQEEQIGPIPYELSTYPIQTFYMEIITDAIGYTGEDYMNHSINYLMEKMDLFMNRYKHAYHIIGLINIQQHNQNSNPSDYETYRGLETSDELYKYIIRIYIKSHFSPQTDADTVMKGFDPFWEKFSSYLGKYSLYRGAKKEYIERLYIIDVEANFRYK